jgi:hypothetical protein
VSTRTIIAPGTELVDRLGAVDHCAAGTGAEHTGGMLIRIEAQDLPGRSCGPSPDRPGGHHRIEVGVQRKDKPHELMGQVSADVESVVWELEAAPVASGVADYRGAYISGPPGGRFIYLSWGVVEEPGRFEMFRRAKIMFDGIPVEVLAEAQESGVLIGRLGLTDPKGNPICAAVRPPLIEWTSGSMRGSIRQFGKSREPG